MRPLAGVIIALGLVALTMLWIETQVEEERPQVASLPVQANKPVSDLPDFAEISDVKQKKRAFFSYLRPTVEQVNREINGQRQFLLQLKQRLDKDLTVSGAQAAKAERIAQQYGYELRQISSETLEPLLARVDTVPVEMVLVQAANETGWGSSRFAREGLNFFGQWCFRAGCGLVPLGRDDGRNHEVAKFDSVEESVSSYLNNLNTNPAYLELRQIRSQLRNAEMEVTAASLIPGLIRYSERKEAYVDELLSMLETNKRYM